jgi:hypothetical protein
MGLIQHIGHWPWKDETGTGPLATDGYFGDGSGTVIDGSAVPTITGNYQLSYPTKEEAMWHFWRVQTWRLTVVTVKGYLDSTERLLIKSVLDPDVTLGREEDLICCRNGIVYRVNRVLNDLHWEASLYVGNVESVNEVQCYYNPNTGLWIPKIKIEINYFKTNAPEDEILVGTIGSPLPYTCTLNGETVNLEGSGEVVSIVFVPDEYWPHGGTYNPSTGSVV